jgi:hypothetical protein
MPASKINLSQMVDLAVGTPEVGAVNANVLHTLLHAMLRQLNIVDVIVLESGMKMREVTKNDKMKTILSTMSIKKISLKKHRV